MQTRRISNASLLEALRAWLEERAARLDRRYAAHLTGHSGIAYPRCTRCQRYARAEMGYSIRFAEIDREIGKQYLTMASLGVA